MEANVTISGHASVSPSIGGARTFDSLSDTPANKTGSGDKLAAVNAAETEIEYITTPWTDLALDVSNLTGHGDEYVKVKADESGFEFST